MLKSSIIYTEPPLPQTNTVVIVIVRKSFFNKQIMKQ